VTVYPEWKMMEKHFQVEFLPRQFLQVQVLQAEFLQVRFLRLLAFGVELESWVQ
jgi:hypothetical protein